MLAAMIMLWAHQGQISAVLQAAEGGAAVRGGRREVAWSSLGHTPTKRAAWRSREVTLISVAWRLKSPAQGRRWC